MTAGSPGKLIITFAIPLMLGNIFQQFYTMADTMIVGRVVGVEALAAVGAGDWLVWLVLGIMTGITQGFSILVSQYYGAGEKENLKCAVAKSYIMTALLSVIVLAVSEGAVYHVLLFLQTPDNVIDLTMLYLRLIFAGVPIIAAYNIFAAILRALGNSRSPLIAMTVAAVINVGLDLLFVAVFGWGVAGAAVATVIAQGFSALYCLLVLRKIRDIRLEKEDFYRQPSMSLRLLKLGTPLAIQNVIISVGGLTVQYVINGFGFLFVAGFTSSSLVRTAETFESDLGGFLFLYKFKRIWLSLSQFWHTSVCCCSSVILLPVKWQVMKLSIVPTAVRLGIWLLSVWWERLFRASLLSVYRAW